MPIQTHNGVTVFVSDDGEDRFPIFDHLEKQKEERKKEAEKKALEEKQRQDELGKIIGTSFSLKDYDTGTIANKLIDQRMAGSIAKLNKAIKDNPQMGEGELRMLVNQEAGTLHGYSSKVKSGAAQILDQSKQLSKESGGNPEAYRVRGLDRFLFKTDPATGQKVQRDLDEIPDDVSNFPTEIGRDHAGELVDAGTAFDAITKGMLMDDFSDDISTDDKGVQSRFKVKGKLYPFQKIAKDKDGKYLRDASGKPYAHVPTYVDKETKVELPDEEVYNRYATKDTGKLLIQTDFNNYNAELKRNGLTPVSPDSREGEVIKRHLLLKRLQKVGVGLDVQQTQGEDSWRAKDRYGYMSPSDRFRWMFGKRGTDAENEAWENSKPGQVKLATKGDQRILKDAAIVQDSEGNAYYDITPKVGGGYIIDKKSSYRGTKVNVAKRVLIPVGKEDSIVIQNMNGTTTPYYGEEAVNSFLNGTSEMNGFNLPKASKQLGIQKDKTEKEKEAEEAKRLIEEKKKKKGIKAAIDAGKNLMFPNKK